MCVKPLYRMENKCFFCGLVLLLTRKCAIVKTGMGGKLLKAVRSFHVDNTACERVGTSVSEWERVSGFHLVQGLDWVVRCHHVNLYI